MECKKMIERPVQHSVFYPYIDVALLDKDLMKTENPLLASKAISWKDSPKDVMARLSSATVIFIHPNVFDKWTDILLLIAQRTSLPVKLIIISQSDYAVGDEHMEVMRVFFPNTTFWIQNWCGLTEGCDILPLGTNGMYKELAEKSQPLGISYVKRYLNVSHNYVGNQHREDFYSFLEKNPAMVDYSLPKCGFFEYCYNLSKCYFTTCPMGEGFDTYRFWESLMVGTIPVVKDHPYYDNLLLQYPNIPIIRLKTWDELITVLPTLTPELHEKMLKDSNLECLTEEYWLNKLRVIKNSIDADKIKIESDESTQTSRGVEKDI